MPEAGGGHRRGPPRPTRATADLVVGDTHSGANWGADVLDAHPQLAALSELRLFSNAGLEPPFRDSHWNPENSERMLGRKMGLGQLLTQERVTPTCGH